ncbi:MAG: ABC transporter substrate-binding protein [Christensenellaceae bacterium]|nr:ABC transporter substrate-binding protein [Christensenellaceae bacterium]
MKKLCFGLLAVLMAAALLAGCAPQNAQREQAPAPAAATPVPKDLIEEDTDAMGEKVAPVEAAELRIVSTAPSTTEILFALGLGDSIVGIDISSTYPPETANIEVVGDFNGFDIEKVIGLEPTVVFAGNGLQHEDIARLKEAGVTVVASEATYYDDIAKSITLIGSVVGKEEEAEALCEQIEQVETAVKEKAAAFEYKPSIYYVMGIGEYGNWTSGKGSFINSVLEMAGGVCVTDDTESEWLEYPLEDLVTADPDVLIVSKNIAEDDLLAAVGYSELTAIKDRHYYFIIPDIIERPGPRIIEALQTVQQAIEKYLAEK